MNTTDPRPVRERKPVRSRRRRWLRRLIVVGCVLAVLLWVANGPGFRFVAKKILTGKLAAAGLEGEFDLAGTALGGVELSGASFSGSKAVTKLQIAEAEIDYDVLGLLQKKGIAAIGPIVVRGISAEFIRLPDAPDKPRKSVRETLRAVGSAWSSIDQAAGLDISVSDVDLLFRSEAGEDAASVEGLALELAEGEGWVGLDRLQIAGVEPIGELRGQLRWLDGAELELTGVEFEEHLAISRLVVGSPASGTGLPSARGELTVFGGSIGLAPEGEERLSVVLDRGAVDLDALGKRFGLELPVTGLVERLNMVVEGRLEDPDSIAVRGEVAASNLTGFQFAGAQASAALWLSNGTLKFDELSLDVAGNSVRGKGELSLAERAADVLPDLHFDLDLACPKLDQLAKVVEQPLSGALDGKLAFRLTAGELRDVTGNLKAMRMRYGSAGLEEFTVRAKPDGRSSDLAFSAIFDAENGVQGAGRFDFSTLSYQAEATADLGELASLAGLLQQFGVSAKVSGSAKADWKGDGQIREGVHRGEAQLGDLLVSSGSVSPISGSALVGYAPGVISATRCDLRSGDLGITGDVRVAEKRLELDAMRVLSTKVEGLELAKVDAALPLDTGALEDADAFFEQPGDVRLKLTSSGLQIADLIALAGQAASLEGAVDADLELGGTLSDLVGKGTIKVRQLKLSGDDRRIAPTDADLAFAISDERLTLDGEARQQGLPPVSLAGHMPLRPRKIAANPEQVAEQSFDLRANFPETPLDALRQFVPILSSADGTLSAELQLSGTTAEPLLAGRVVANASRLKFQRAGLPSVTDLAVDVEFKGDRAEINEARVTLAGGRIELGGGAQFTSVANPALHLSLTASEALLYRDENMSLRSNADLKLSGPLAEAHLSGRLGIVHSQFVREIEILPIGLPRLQAAPSAPRAPALDAPNDIGIRVQPLADWTLDVQIGTDQPFQVRSNLAQATVLADLRVTGTGARPLAIGKVWLGEDSKATLPFSEMTVREGILEFDEETGLDPRVRFVGVSEIRGNEIALRVYDRLSRPRTLISSDPPLPEEDAVTLLATGRRAAELGEREVIASAAAGLLFDKVRRKVFKRSPKSLREPFGDNVEIKAGGVDPKTGNRGISTTVKVSERVYLVGGIDTGGEYRGLVKLLVRVK